LERNRGDIRRRVEDRNLHLSSNVFNNVLIAELTRALWIAGTAGVVLGDSSAGS